MMKTSLSGKVECGTWSVGVQRDFRGAQRDWDLSQLEQVEGYIWLSTPGHLQAKLVKCF
jgi:hypothetical protein